MGMRMRGLRLLVTKGAGDIYGEWMDEWMGINIDFS